MELKLSIMFFLAMLGTTFFFGKLMTWVVTKIAPKNCTKRVTREQIKSANFIMFISICLWTIIFYNLIK